MIELTTTDGVATYYTTLNTIEITTAANPVSIRITALAHDFYNARVGNGDILPEA